MDDDEDDQPLSHSEMKRKGHILEIWKAQSLGGPFIVHIWLVCLLIYFPYSEEIRSLVSSRKDMMHHAASWYTGCLACQILVPSSPFFSSEANAEKLSLRPCRLINLQSRPTELLAVISHTRCVQQLQQLDSQLTHAMELNLGSPSHAVVVKYKYFASWSQKAGLLVLRKVHLLVIQNDPEFWLEFRSDTKHLNAKIMERTRNSGTWKKGKDLFDHRIWLYFWQWST